MKEWQAPTLEVTGTARTATPTATGRGFGGRIDYAVPPQTKTKLPKSDYDLDTFKGKVFRSVNFMEESSFSLYPVIGFVKNLTNRIVKSYLESEKA